MESFPNFLSASFGKIYVHGISFILTGSQHTYVDVHGLVSGSPCTYSRSMELVTDLLYGEQLTFLFRWRRDGYGNGCTEGRAGGGEKE